MREVALEAVQVDENVAMWTIICRSTVVFMKGKPCFYFGNRMICIKKQNVDLESDARYCVLWEGGL